MRLQYESRAQPEHYKALIDGQRLTEAIEIVLAAGIRDRFIIIDLLVDLTLLARIDVIFAVTQVIREVQGEKALVRPEMKR